MTRPQIDVFEPAAPWMTQALGQARNLPDRASAQDRAFQEMRERHDRIRAALAHPAQIEALRMVLAAEGRSYKPGFDHASTAYLEGRKHALDDLISFLTKQEAN